MSPVFTSVPTIPLRLWIEYQSVMQNYGNTQWTAISPERSRLGCAISTLS